MPPLLSSYITNQRLKAAAGYVQGDILDLGCGYGHLIRFLHPGQVYVGVDGSTTTIAWLKSHYPSLRFYQRDFDREPLEIDSQFDRIFLLALLEHLAHPDKILNEIPAYLRPGGKVIITTPSKRGGWLHNLGARFGLVYTEAARDHKNFYDYPDLSNLITIGNLSIEKYRRFLLGENQLIVGVKNGT